LPLARDLLVDLLEIGEEGDGSMFNILLIDFKRTQRGSLVAIGQSLNEAIEDFHRF
jgi:hypothetical protein